MSSSCIKNSKDWINSLSTLFSNTNKFDSDDDGVNRYCLSKH